MTSIGYLFHEDNHAVARATPAIDALDNYDPFQKRLAVDYRFFD